MGNNIFYEANRTPAVLQEDKKGNPVALVRQDMIDAMKGICEDINANLAKIPQLLQENNLSEYDSEALQRDIVRNGFDALQVEVYDRTLRNLEKTGLFPKIRKELATKNADCLPQELRTELDGIRDCIKSSNRDLIRPINLDDLMFEEGKLRIPAEALDFIVPTFTIAISSDDADTVKKIRDAAALMAELKFRGVQVSDEMCIPPRGGNPILVPGLITRMASGSEYTDAELLGLLHGIQLNH